MSSSWKPKSYNSVSPYLIVEGAGATIDFVIAAFDAVELRRFPSPEDSSKIMHAEVRIDDTVVMIADRPAEWPAVPAHVHVYVADVDATYELALAAGATAVQEPIKQQDDDKRGGVRDAGGTTWWISTKVV
jgi:PhnB protein